VLDGRADVAVHSLKDLPTEPAEGLALAAVPERASPFDAVVLPKGAEPVADAASVRAEAGSFRHVELAALADGARVGTGSPRRSAQLLHWRPDLKIGEIRGNVETRVRKLDDGEFDAVILAEAGLHRLDLGDRISRRLAPPLFYPAVGQGALGIECRSDDAETRRLLGEIDHSSTHAAVAAERKLMSALGAGCHAPVGVETAIENDRLSLAAVVLSTDGTVRLFAELTGSLAEPTVLGRAVAEELMRQGAGEYV
jgi:hydroxymethylbilane synthase